MTIDLEAVLVRALVTKALVVQPAVSRANKIDLTPKVTDVSNEGIVVVVAPLFSCYAVLRMGHPRIIRLAAIFMFFTLATIAQSFGKGMMDGVPCEKAAQQEAAARGAELSSIKWQIGKLGSALKEKLEQARWELDPQGVQEQAVVDVVRDFFRLVRRFQVVSRYHRYRTESISELYSVFFEGLALRKLHAPDHSLLWRIRQTFGFGQRKLTQKICELNLTSQNALRPPNQPFR